MARPRRGLPTERELEILKVLWGDHGPSTVRAVREALAPRRPVTYGAVLAMLQIMTAKGLVRPEKTRPAYLYRSCQSRCTVLRTLAGDLLERVCDGSLVALVRYALECQKETDPGELAAIRRDLKEMAKADGGARP